MNLLRKIKISKLVNVKFSDTEKEILDICDKKLKYLHCYVWGNISTIYTNSCSDFIFEANHNHKKIYINREHFWDLIIKKLNYIDTQQLLSYLIKNKYEQYASYYAMPKY